MRVHLKLKRRVDIPIAGQGADIIQRRVAPELFRLFDVMKPWPANAS